MTDLDKLITTIRDGAWKSDHLSLPTWHLVFEAKLGIHADAIHAAYCGSLDAAKRLHDALLPGWGWMVGDKGTATVIPPERLFAETGVIGPTCRVDGNPARAWLLAILRAVQAKEAIPPMTGPSVGEGEG